MAGNPPVPKRGRGRPKGARNKATVRAKQSIADRAQAHADEALDVLLAVARDDDAPGVARVAAANAILDRGFGKPVQAHDVSGQVALTVKISL